MSVSNLGGYHSREQLFCSKHPATQPGLKLLESIATAAILAADLEDGGDEQDSLSTSSRASDDDDDNNDDNKEDCRAEAIGEEDVRSSAAVPKESWVNVSRAGHANGMHDHQPSTWSGVYYARTGSHAVASSGKIVFRVSEGGFALVGEDGAGQEKDVSREPKTEGWCRYVAANPRAGDLLLFPAWLKHLVLPFRPKKPGATRISVAFNA